LINQLTYAVMPACSLAKITGSLSISTVSTTGQFLGINTIGLPSKCTSIFLIKFKSSVLLKFKSFNPLMN